MAGYGLFLALLMVMRLAPDSALGRMLNRHLVERPLEWLGELDRRQLLYAVSLVAMCLGAGEAIAVIGSDFLAVYAWDLAVYLDAVAVTYALAAVAKTKVAMRAVRLRGASLLGRFGRRARRARRTGAARKVPPDSASNDDDPAPAWALAA